MNLKAIHQIEITSRCNLACVYCPHSKMSRPQLDMTDDIFERALMWVDFFRERGTQITEAVGFYNGAELNLAGTGEPTLHPSLADYVGLIRSEYGDDLKIIITTNGLLLDDALGRRLAPYHPTVYISMHRPVEAAKAIVVAQKYGLLAGAALDPATSPNDWAGQVDWIKPSYRFPCPWLHINRAFVAADGQILTCCLDVDGSSRIGSVLEEPRADVRQDRWSLCARCYQDPP